MSFKTAPLRNLTTYFLLHSQTIHAIVVYTKVINCPSLLQVTSATTVVDVFLTPKRTTSRLEHINVDPHVKSTMNARSTLVTWWHCRWTALMTNTSASRTRSALNVTRRKYPCAAMVSKHVIRAVTEISGHDSGLYLLRVHNHRIMF